MRTQALENSGSTAHNNDRCTFKDMHVKKVAWSLCIVTLLIGVAYASSTATTGRKTYKWVDEQGVTHYGDHIPPEYAKQEQHVINSQGVETERLEAQKSPDQMAAEEQKRLETEQRQNRDKNLLSTYGSVQEIERLRDQRVNLLSDQIRVTSQFLDGLNGKLNKLRGNALLFKPYNTDPKAPRMPDQLADDLVRVAADIHTQQENLREKSGEVATMKKQFESDIARFKELKAAH